MSFNDREVYHVIGRDLYKEPDSKEGNPYPHFAGIELELENVELTGPKMKQWKNVPDDSLRNGMEFVTKEPYTGARLAAAIAEFYANKVAFQNSPRTSTHIHINVTDMKVSELRAMFAISYMVEFALFRVLDPARKYCGYCMQLTDMNPKRATTFLTADEPGTFVQSMGGPNANKYYGFNINSVRKHGTAEFRYFPGGPDEEQLKQWVKYCQQVKSAAKSAGLDGVLNLESAAEVEGFIRAAFPELGEQLLADESAQQMFQQLQEVNAMFPDEDIAERRERLVFLSEPLVAYAAKQYLKTKFKEDFLRKSLMPLKVVTLNEWYDRLDIARQQRDPEEEARHRQMFDAARDRMGPDNREVTFDQWAIRMWGRGAEGLTQDYPAYVAFLRRHKRTLIDMYAEHIRATRHVDPTFVAATYTEEEYQRISDPNNGPRFLDAPQVAEGAAQADADAPAPVRGLFDPEWHRYIGANIPAAPPPRQRASVVQYGAGAPAGNNAQAARDRAAQALRGMNLNEVLEDLEYARDPFRNEPNDQF